MFTCAGVLNCFCMEMLDIINENDEVIGQVERAAIYANGHRHRIVHVWVLNEKGELALQRRSKHCGYAPLHWCSSAAGHVGAGEERQAAALRELKEELGIDAQLACLGLEPWQGESAPALLSLYKTTYNGAFLTDPLVIDRVQWFSSEQIVRMIDEGEAFTPQFKHLFQLYLQ